MPGTDQPAGPPAALNPDRLPVMVSAAHLPDGSGTGVSLLFPGDLYTAISVLDGGRVLHRSAPMPLPPLPVVLTTTEARQIASALDQQADEIDGPRADDGTRFLATTPYSPVGIQAALVAAFYRGDLTQPNTPDSRAAQVVRARVGVRAGGYTVELEQANRDLAYRIAALILDSFWVHTDRCVHVDVSPVEVTVVN